MDSSGTYLIGENNKFNYPKSDSDSNFGTDIVKRKYVRVRGGDDSKYVSTTEFKKYATSSKKIITYINQKKINAIHLKNTLDDCGAIVKYKFAFIEEGKFVFLKKIANIVLSKLKITNKGKLEKIIDNAINSKTIANLKAKIYIKHQEFQDIRKTINQVVLNENLYEINPSLKRESFSEEKAIIKEFKEKVLRKISKEEAKEFIGIVRKDRKASQENKDIKAVLEYFLKDKEDTETSDNDFNVYFDSSYHDSSDNGINFDSSDSDEIRNIK